MKLFICTECNDVQMMAANKPRRCKCGRSWGMYVGEPIVTKNHERDETILSWENVRAGGDARVFGINNISFALAMKGTLATFEGWFYDTGYIETDTIEYTKEVNNEQLDKDTKARD